jgi:hypothetical protein
MLIFIAAAQLPFFYIACYFWRAAQANRLTLRHVNVKYGFINVELVARALRRCTVDVGGCATPRARAATPSPTGRAGRRPSRRATPTEMCEIQIGIESEKNYGFTSLFFCVLVGLYLRFTVNGISTQLPWSPISSFLDREDKTNVVPCVLFHSF